MHSNLTITPHDTPHRPLCQVCQERQGEAYIGQLLVCSSCFCEAKNEEISLYRASLRLIRGGYPR